jgi:CheY-like chemotaxis protein
MTDKPDKTANILIVEDQLRGRIELGEMLEFFGYAVCRAKSGKHAVTMVSKNKGKIDIILMDIKMPGKIDGIEAVRQIQAKTRKIPIIFITAYADDMTYRQKVKEINLKVAGWVDKPIIDDNEKNLMSLIKKELEKKAVRIEIEAGLQKNIPTAKWQPLLEKLILLYGVDFMVEVVEDIEWIYPKNQIAGDVLFPYLNYLAFKNMRNELEKKYPGQLIAFSKGKLIGHDKRRDDLINSIYRSRGRTDIYITELNNDQSPIKFRHPVRIIR